MKIKMKINNLTPLELADWLATELRLQPVLLDVREEWEFQTGHIDGSLAMPMNTIADRLSELDTQQPIVCICHHGVRSMQVGLFLERNGFTDISNLTGGVHAWSQQVDSAIPLY
jgi:rhodanese-related sulfurtransferase